MLLLLACKEGERLENQAPDTWIFVDAINLSGENRLNSLVKLHWFGEDVDGYVNGYEISLDQQNWDLVQRQDSTFRFSLAPDSDTTDIDFWVRAVDNLGLADPSPAYLKVPIRNSPPTVALDTVNTIPDTVQGVFSVQWSLSDIDGEETLDTVFVRLNEGPWLPLNRDVRFLTFIPQAAGTLGAQPAEVLTGIQARPVATPIQDLRVGAENQLLVRARDLTGAFSEVDSSNVFFVKPQRGDLLVVDAHGTAGPDGVYFPILDEVYPAYDYLNLRDNFPPFWEPTFAKLLQQYDKVFWYSDGTEYSILGEQQLMEIASAQIQEYLNTRGKLLVSTKFASTFFDPSANFRSTIFDFSPMDSLSSSSGQARIVRNAKVMPLPGFAENLDTLISSAFITGADPFYAKNAINDMLTAELTPVGGWTGPSTVAGSTVFTNGEVNQVFCTLELNLLNGDPEALKTFFDYVLNDLFDW